MCAASLAPEAAAREERKVVTVLFCDLVGFTAKAEQLDPEDVRAVLGPYHARLRAEVTTSRSACESNAPGFARHGATSREHLLTIAAP
jgi:class 3 adenylate cyclase